MTFKEKIVRLRKLKGLTQDEFASAVGVSRQAVYKWESGQSFPEVPKLLEIKLLFGVSIDDLLDDSFEVALPEKKKRKRLSAEVKKRIEEEVKLEEAEIAAAPEAEKVSVAPVTKAEEPVTETAPAAEEKEAEAPAKAANEKKAEAAETAEPEKKKGFFSRIFGRK